jgi:hypothetical protein
MTSVVKGAQMLGGVVSDKLLFLLAVVGHTRVSAEMGPVLPTVDPADIRGLGTTVL